ncbi:hypothetical protein DCO47_23570 [Pseudomonas sp. NDM]|nr:hypothetical protein DCO47_23570 [Pseudomonas sp. NDM]
MSLLAIAVYQSEQMSADTALSRAGSLLQGNAFQGEATGKTPFRLPSSTPKVALTISGNPTDTSAQSYDNLQQT